MPRIIGEIAYLDSVAIGELLQVVQGGLLVNFKRNVETTRERKSSLAAAFSGISADHGATRTSKDGEELAMTRSPAGELGQLFNLLDGKQLISQIFGSDPKVWSSVEEGEFIECAVRTSIAPFQALLADADDLLAKFSEFAPLFAPEQADQLPKLKEQIGAIRAIFNAQGALPVFMQPSDDDGGPRKFFGYLDTSAEVYRPRALVGSGVVLGRVKRVLRDRESVDLLKIGNYSLPRETVRQLLVSLQNNPFGRPVKLGDLKVSAPAIELQVLAIVA